MSEHLSSFKTKFFTAIEIFRREKKKCTDRFDYLKEE